MEEGIYDWLTYTCIYIYNAGGLCFRTSIYDDYNFIFIYLCCTYVLIFYLYTFYSTFSYLTFFGILEVF